MTDTKAPGKKWTKRDVKSLRGAIDSWWLHNGMYLRQGVTKEQVFATMPLGERARICVSHWRGFAAMLDERVHGHTGYKATYEHYATKRGIPGWGDADEIVERFRKLEAETLDAAAKARALAERVQTEGLPAELEDYIPER